MTDSATPASPHNDLSRLIDAFAAEQTLTPPAGVRTTDAAQKRAAKLDLLSVNRDRLQKAFETAMDAMATPAMREASVQVEAAMLKTGFTTIELDSELAKLHAHYADPAALNITPERKRIETTELVHRMTDSVSVATAEAPMQPVNLREEIIQQYIGLSNLRANVAALAEHAMDVIKTEFPANPGTRDLNVLRKMRETTRELVPLLNGGDATRHAETRVAMNIFDHSILQAVHDVLEIPKQPNHPR